MPDITGYSILDHKSIERPAWKEYVSRHEQGTIFHSSFIFDTFSKTNYFQPFALFAVDAENKIKAMLQGFTQTIKSGPLATLSTRAVLLKSPLYAELDALKSALNSLKEYTGKRAVYTEIRSHWIDEDSKAIYTELGFTEQKHLNYLVDSTNADKTWQNLSESKRRQIKKALGNGAEIVDNPSQKQFDEFYQILSQLYVQKVRKPLPSHDFFQSLYDCSKTNPDMLKFMLINYENKIIGGICCPVSDKKAIHELYVAGLDADFKDFYPSSLATWSAMDYAAKNSIAVFDFMGAGNPDEDYGVREFKSRFGGTLLETGRYQYVHSPVKMKLAETGFKLLRKFKGMI